MKKWLIGCGIFVVVALLVAGIVAGGFAIWGYYKVKDTVAMSPAQVQVIADKIMRYDLPGQGVGIFAMDMGMRMALVSDQKENGSVLLVLFSMPAQQQAEQAQAEAQIQARLQQWRGAQGQFVAEAVHAEPGTLCSEPVTVAVSNGSFTRNGHKTPACNRAAGFMKNGTYYYAMVMGTSADREARTQQIFNSLRLP